VFKCDAECNVLLTILDFKTSFQRSTISKILSFCLGDSKHILKFKIVQVFPEKNDQTYRGNDVLQHTVYSNMEEFRKPLNN
jgi:hypothetical protein